MNADFNSANKSEDAAFIARYESRFKLALDKDWSYRQKKLFILKKFFDASIYDNLLPFHAEYDGGGKAGKYVELIKRRPSVIYNLPKIIVNESTGMLFGEQHFPVVRCKTNGENDENVTDFLQYITETAKLKRKMLEAAKKGSVGSVCIVVKVLEGKFHLDVLRTQTLTPSFDQMHPEKLIKLVEKKKVDGYSIRAFGYTVAKKDLNKMFYFVREWNNNEEIYYVPYLCEDEIDTFKPSKDEKLTTKHGFGFVPAIWIKNISEDEDIDGECTYEGILDNTIEICYQLSQLGRLFKYSSDPTLIVKNPSSLEGDKLIKGTGILNLDEHGDAYYAEMQGNVTSKVMDYVNKLREFAIEVARGNRSNPEKISGAQSGKAIKLLNGALISLVGELRLTYGEDGLISLYTMILNICKLPKSVIDYGDGKLQSVDKNKEYHLCLEWPELYPITPEEELQKAQTITLYKEKGVISTETAIKNVADDMNIIDASKELSLVEKEAEVAHTRERESARGASNKK